MKLIAYVTTETAKTISQTGTWLLPLLSRLPPPKPPPHMPKYRPQRVISAASIAKKLASVMINTSRFATCESSCASTASTSCGSSLRHSPSVTATAACFGLRPVAKAFGTSLGMIAMRGFGRPAIAQRRSTIACSSGASCGETIFAPDAASASLSDVQYWKTAIPTTISSIGTRPTFSTWSSTTAKPT